MRKFTKEDFVTKAKAVHGDKYDYSETEYLGSTKKVRIRCEKHGYFEVYAAPHIQGRGCQKCSSHYVSGRPKVSFDDFLIKAKEVHGDKYEYDMDSYYAKGSNINVTCSVHGAFETNAANHINKKTGCQLCRSEQIKTHSKEKFFEEVKKIHGNKYDYSLVTNFDFKEKIPIICSNHGVFYKLRTNHINLKQGCPMCAKENAKNISNIDVIDDNLINTINLLQKDINLFKLTPQEAAIYAFIHNNNLTVTKDQLEEHFKFPLPVICRMRKKGVRIETVRVYTRGITYKLIKD